MEIRTDDPVGDVVPRRTHRAHPRHRSGPIRLAAAVVLITFVTVSVATTVFSLGAYCLTSGTGPIGWLGH